MKVVIVNTRTAAADLQQLIHDDLIANVRGYNADRWCVPIRSIDGTKYAVPIDDSITLRGASIINGTMKRVSNMVEEIDRTDPFWFDQTQFPTK